jgi:hypothetical protein
MASSFEFYDQEYVCIPPIRATCPHNLLIIDLITSCTIQIFLLHNMCDYSL